MKIAIICALFWGLSAFAQSPPQWLVTGVTQITSVNTNCPCSYQVYPRTTLDSSIPTSESSIVLKLKLDQLPELQALLTYEDGWYTSPYHLFNTYSFSYTGAPVVNHQGKHDGVQGIKSGSFISPLTQTLALCRNTTQ